MRLTSRNVLTLEAGEHPDALVPGLRLRVTESSRSWGFRYTFAGQRARVDLGPLEQDKREEGKLIAADIERARNLARLLVAGLVRGEDPRVSLKRADSDSLTVPELCARAIEEIPLKPTTRVGYRNHLRRNIEAQFRGVIAAHLSRAAIRAWGAEIKKRGPYESNRAFEVLRRCYSWGVENEILEATPFVKLPLPFDGEKIRRRILSTDELARLMARLNADNCGFADAVWLLLLTGVRKDSVDSLLLSDIKGDVWTIPDTKNDLAHPVPLSKQALAVIERQRDRIPRRSKHLFPILRPDDHVKRSYSTVPSTYTLRLKEHLGGEPWKIHDLRTTIATHLEDELGVDLRIISLILGHVPKDVPESTRAYALGQRLADRRIALQKWADWLETLRIGPQAAHA